MKEHIADMLYATIVDGDCRLYRLSLDIKGYGRVFYGKKNRLAHRYMWECHHGPIPAGHVIMHLCDRPQCININHLRCGTQKENIQDAQRKKRIAVGSRLPQAILTEDKVKLILADLAQGQLTQRQIARKFGIHFAIVSDIKCGKTWKSVSQPSP